MGNYRPLRTLDDLVRDGLDLRVTCEAAKCGNAQTLSAIGLRKQLGRVDFAALEQRLVCSRCGERWVTTVPRERS